MRNILKIFFGSGIICLLFLGFWGCKKYPEDHQFPWHTAFHRVTRIGQLTKYVVNGIDSTAYLSNKLLIVHSGQTGTWDNNFYFQSSKNGAAYNLECNGIYGDWRFLNKKGDIGISFCSDPNNVVFENVFVDCYYKVWHIQKLTDTEMHIKTEYKGNIYELFFKNH